MRHEEISVSIIVPVYNSANTLGVLFSRIDAALRTAGLQYEIIFVDDCSTDDSWQKLRSLCSANPRITAIRLGINHGQWSATLAGMSTATGKYIVTIDDDLEYQPEDIALLYRYICDSSFQVVFGLAADKYKLQGKSSLIAGWRNNILNALWNKPVTDSFKILCRDLVFENGHFMVKEHFESYVKRRLHRRFWGYTQIGFSARSDGSSRHTFYKKLELFFLFTTHYMIGSSKEKLTWTIAEKINSIPRE